MSMLKIGRTLLIVMFSVSMLLALLFDAKNMSTIQANIENVSFVIQDNFSQVSQESVVIKPLNNKPSDTPTGPSNLYLPMIFKLVASAPSWHYLALGESTGAPPAAGAPAAYERTLNGSLHVVYRGTDDQIHELWYADDKWRYTAISESAGAPPAAGDLAAYERTLNGSLHVVYRGTDDQIHELWYPDDEWRYTSISESAGAPAAASDPAAYERTLNGSLHVVYRGTDDQIHELWYPNDEWRYTAVSESAEAPLTATGKPAAYERTFDESLRVVYRGTDSQIHELRFSESATR